MATTKAKGEPTPTATAGAGPAWVETTVEEFLGLDAVDAQVVEFRLRVAREARRLREAARLSQAKLAGRLGVSQPRIPAIERAEPGTSTEAILSAFFAAGGTLADLAAVLGPGAP